MNTPTANPLAEHAIESRPAIRSLARSKIREVANASMENPDVLPFWFGEPDQVTAQFVRAAAVEALNNGDTFYTPNLGTSDLRQAIADYLSALHAPVDAGRVAVIGSGVEALMLAWQTLVGPGDRVVAVTPVWPNVVEQPRILGAAVTRVALRARDGDWQLDLDRLYAALTPQTRAVVINSPNNPTGWVISRDEQRAILQHCRRHGIWIIADEVYERLIFDGSRCAPSFLDIADASDRLIVTNTFSKSWLMTGWRLGWLVSPRGADGRTLLDDLANVIEYNYSCVPGFVQRGGVAAIRHGEETTRAFVGRLAAARDFLLRELGRLPEIEVTRPAGAMYAFFRVPSADSLALAKSLVREAGLGLAPGIAFGAEGEGYLRWCFASSLDRLAIGLERFTRYLGRKK